MLDAAERSARGLVRQRAFGKESSKRACGLAKKRRTLGEPARPECDREEFPLKNRPRIVRKAYIEDDLAGNKICP